MAPPGRRGSCAASVVASAAVARAALAAEDAASPPSILFLLTDQQRWDAVSEELTPNLHALSLEGVKFLTAYSSVPTCTPARSAILTGLAPWYHGMLGYGQIAKKYDLELASALAAKGYRTVVVGKNHFGWSRSTGYSDYMHGFEDMTIYDGLGAGTPGSREWDAYDDWFQSKRPGEDPQKTGGLGWNTWRGHAYEYEEHLHPTAWTGRRAVAKLEELGSGTQPFFLKVSFHRPHSPYDPPSRLLDVQGDPPRKIAISTDGWDAKYRFCGERGERVAYCGEVEADALRTTRRAYLACVTQVDEEIGKIMAKLRTTAFANNTFILFTSDHGDMQLDHFLWKKGYPYEGSTHIPMIVRWPESMDGTVTVARGSTQKVPVELRDILPTFLDVSGGWLQSYEQTLQGRPLTWLLRDDAVSWRKWIDMEHTLFYIGSWSGLTDGEIKYVYHANSGDEQMFNLTDDPDERRDLATSTKFDGLRELWRERLVDQYENEGRGCGWTCFGHLTPRPLIRCLYSPHYPDFDVERIMCSISSAMTFQGFIALVIIVLLLFMCCFVCGGRWFARRRRRRKERAEEMPSESMGKIGNGEPPSLVQTPPDSRQVSPRDQEEDAVSIHSEASPMPSHQDSKECGSPGTPTEGKANPLPETLPLELPSEGKDSVIELPKLPQGPMDPRLTSSFPPPSERVYKGIDS